MGSHLLKVMAPHFYCKNGEKESGKNLYGFTVTRTCYARYTNVLHALHVGVPPVTRTCNAMFGLSFLCIFQIF